LAVVLAVELGRTFVADLKGSICGIHTFSQHKSSGFLPSQLLLESQRIKSGQGPEMMMKR